MSTALPIYPPHVASPLIAQGGEVFGIGLAALKRKQFPPVAWTVPDILPEGCAILAGRPKLGKSWLALDTAIGVARGGFVMGKKCTEGDVLYLALEDNERRLQSRIRKILQNEPWPDRVTLATEWPRADKGGVAKVKRWASSTALPRLVIVDVLTAFRAHPDANEKRSSYATDYEAVAQLRDLANELSLTVLIVHHVRKGDSDDPIEAVSGTLGLSGAADTILVLNRRPEAGVTLYGRGRDIEEIDLALQFLPDNCRWSVKGQTEDVSRSDERNEILAILWEAKEPMSPTDIAALAEKKNGSVRRLLLKMIMDGSVVKTGRGLYIHAKRGDLLRSYTPGNSGNGGNNEGADYSASPTTVMKNRTSDSNDSNKSTAHHVAFVDDDWP